MSRDCNTSLSRMAVTVGFLCVLFAASSLADPVTTSVVTPLGSAQLVASASDRDEGLSPKDAALPTLGSDEEKQTGAAASGAILPPPAAAAASEAGDMMKDPYHNVTTISTSDRDEEAMINSDTDTVQDSHVNPINKTHEEEASGSSTDSPLDGSAVHDASTVPVTESSTSKVEEPEREEKVEEKEQSEKQNKTSTTSEEVDVTEQDGEMSLAEVTSLPVSALVSQHDAHDHPVISRNPRFNHTTQAAAILAGVLVLVAIMGYLGLLMWRRMLEKRYGNREMLVNEDDDFKHFEL